MKFAIAVKGIIRKDDKILVMRRSENDDHRPGNWETVGGGMDADETPQQTLMREIKEEAGIEVTISKPFNVFTFTKDAGEFKVGITFLCDWINGEVGLSEEHSEYKWIKPSEFALLESVPSLHEEINRYSKIYEK